MLLSEHCNNTQITFGDLQLCGPPDRLQSVCRRTMKFLSTLDPTGPWSTMVCPHRPSRRGRQFGTLLPGYYRFDHVRNALYSPRDFVRGSTIIPICLYTDECASPSGEASFAIPPRFSNDGPRIRQQRGHHHSDPSLLRC